MVAVAVAVAGFLTGVVEYDDPITVAEDAALPDGLVPALLNNTDALRAILLYNVVSGEVYARDVVNLALATTAQGQPVAITVSGGNVYVGLPE